MTAGRLSERLIARGIFEALERPGILKPHASLALGLADGLGVGGSVQAQHALAVKREKSPKKPNVTHLQATGARVLNGLDIL